MFSAIFIAPYYPLNIYLPPGKTLFAIQLNNNGNNNNNSQTSCPSKIFTISHNNKKGKDILTTGLGGL
jgi:hypothetical protein